MLEGMRKAAVLLTFPNPPVLHLAPPQGCLFPICLPPPKVFCRLLRTEMALTPSFLIALSSELALSGEKRMGTLQLVSVTVCQPSSYVLSS